VKTYIETPDSPYWNGKHWKIRILEKDHVLYTSSDSQIRIQRHNAARWFADWIESLIEQDQFREYHEHSQMCWIGTDGSWQSTHQGIVGQITLLDGREDKGIWQLSLPHEGDVERPIDSVLKHIKPRNIHAAKWFAELLLRYEASRTPLQVQWKRSLVYQNTVSSFGEPEKWIPFAQQLQDTLESAIQQPVKVFHEPLIDFNECVSISTRLSELRSIHNVAIVQWSTVWGFSHFGILVKDAVLLDKVQPALTPYQLMGMHHLDQALLPQFKAALLSLYDTERLAHQLFKEFPNGTVFLTGWVDDEADESQYDSDSYYEIKKMKLHQFPSLGDFAATWKEYPWVFVDDEDSLVDELYDMADINRFPCDPKAQLSYLRKHLHRFNIAVLANNSDCDFDYSVVLDNRSVQSWKDFEPIAYW